MRLTYRNQSNINYWSDRWNAVDVDDEMTNEDVYPLKYAKMLNPKGTILEAGCGAGRILRYYKNRGYDITGIDFIENVIDSLKQSDPELDVYSADIRELPFESGSFGTVLAFGLYHNFHGDDLHRVLKETNRITANGGLLCASFRADNIQNRINDWQADFQNKKLSLSRDDLHFHKANIGYSEFGRLVNQHGFEVENILPVVNMPLLYKFSAFRAKGHKRFNESTGRVEGYCLNTFGTFINNILMKLMPNQFCNVYVAIAKKQGPG